MMGSGPHKKLQKSNLLSQCCSIIFVSHWNQKFQTRTNHQKSDGTVFWDQEDVLLVNLTRGQLDWEAWSLTYRRLLWDALPGPLHYKSHAPRFTSIRFFLTLLLYDYVIIVIMLLLCIDGCMFNLTHNYVSELCHNNTRFASAMVKVWDFWASNIQSSLVLCHSFFITESVFWWNMLGKWSTGSGSYKLLQKLGMNKVLWSRDSKTLHYNKCLIVRSYYIESRLDSGL